MINPYGLKKLLNNKLVFDDFRHEQFLLINDTLISGCSHKGILNILSSIDIKNIIGGFHLNKENDYNINLIANKMNTYNINYYTCHCTGIDAYKKLKETLKNRISYIKAGDIIKI